MSQISEVNNQIISAISKDDEFYQALWGKDPFSPSATIVVPNDYNCGAFCNALEYLFQYIRDLTEYDISKLEYPYIDIICYFFVGIKRFPGEETFQLVNRLKSLTVRECDFKSEKLGTPWDILNVLCYYLERSLLFYVPNAILTDLMVNGDFETAIGAEWTFSPSGDRSIEDGFSGDWKVDFSGFTSLSQTISLTAGSFILHGFVNPSVAPVGDTDILNIDIQRSSDSYYFNTSTLAWQVSNPNNVYSTDKEGYNLMERFVIVDGSYDVTFTFVKIVDFLLDHVEFGEKLYPAFEIIYLDSGFATDFASVWETGILPYENASYLDQDFMFASATSSYSDVYFQSLIDNIAASGVKGIFRREVRT